MATGTRTGPLARLVSRLATPEGAPGGVSLTIRKGDVLGLVGEPGSGKTALGRTLIGLTRAAGGSVRYRGQEITGLSERKMRPLRPLMQTLFLPHTPFTPGGDLRTAVGQPLRALGPLGATGTGGDAEDAEALDARVRRALERVGLTPADEYLDRDPADLPAHQRQRAAVARAIAAEPELLLVGEPPSGSGDSGTGNPGPATSGSATSGPDSAEWAETMRLLLDLKRELDLTCVHITRHLASAESFCDTVAVVHLGRIVETGPAKQVCSEPRHPYTRALLALAPGGGPRQVGEGRGGPPDPARPPFGCSYHPRCPAALDMCGWEARDLLTLLERRWLDLDPEQAVDEQRLLGRLDALEEPGLGRVALAPGKGHDAAEVLDYFLRLRAEASATEPREPFWRGVAKLYEDSGHVVVEFTPAEDPVLGAGTLLPVEGPTERHAARVACHLYTGSAD